MANETIFSKIIRGEIPCTKIYEDSNVLAFLDIHPNNFGHTLVILKNEYENLFEIPDEEISLLFLSVKRLSIAVKEGMSATGINIAMNNGIDAGQDVFHAHIHVIPRFPNDGFKQGRHLEYKEGQMGEVADKIKSFI